MLLPLSWLKDFVDLPDVTPEELEEKLFQSGFEVEEKTYLGAEVSNCVVGLITEIEKHPNSDHLQICQLNCGSFGEKIQIVTGAQNVFVGALVPAALDGAHLADDIKIKNGMLRGIASNGMLCSGAELGITEDFFPNAGVDGILILPETAQPGQDIKKVVGLDDWVFDIKVTPNRPDAESIYGLAREVAAIFKTRVRHPQLIFTAHENLENKLTVSVEDQENCPKYSASILDSVRVGPSPFWLRQRLIKCGINAINNVVDITNYVLLELGQPMHAFDYNLLEGAHLVARPAREGETITTLDEKTSTLTPKNLVIADAKKPLALAGIMGGLQSGVSPETKVVALESAVFMRESVRKTSRALGIASDSSHRFEKGIDTFTTTLAMNRALNLFETLGVGRPTTCAQNVEAARPLNQPITFTAGDINKVLGIEVPKDEIISILTRLDFKVEENKATITATAPEYRKDVDGVADLAEEVIRIYGYKHIVPKLLSDTRITRGGYNTAQQQELRIKRTLASLGLNEIITYSFASAKDLDLLKLPPEAPERNFVKIQNPLSEDVAVMKTTLVAGMLSIIAKNYKKGIAAGALFEIANTYFPKEQPMVSLPREDKKLCIGAWGEKCDFFTLKGIIESFASAHGLTLAFEATGKEFLHPYRSAKILLSGQVVGFIGQLAYDISETLSISQNTFVAELNYPALTAQMPASYAYEIVSKHPDVKRDLALVVREEITSAQVEEQILAASKKVSSVTLFDVYRSDALGAGLKSLAYNLVFRAGEEPLTHEEVDSQIKKILGRAAHFLGASIRE